LYRGIQFVERKNFNWFTAAVASLQRYAGLSLYSFWEGTAEFLVASSRSQPAQ
jgi:hypothetical protein